MEELLNRLISLNITLSENDNQIDVYDPDENLSPQIIAEIKDNKTDILRHFKSLEYSLAPKFIPKASKKSHYPLSPSQKRMFFLYEMDKNSLAYNMPQTYKVKGSLDVTHLELIFNELISRHEILRTNFELIDGKPVQKIKRKVKFNIACYQAQKSEIEAVIRNFVSPFNLSTDCLLRVGIIDLGDYKILMIDMHHIIGDGMSHNILVQDFKVLYEGGILERLKLQYKDYVEWQQGEQYQKSIEQDKHFWLDIFDEEILTLDLPTDFKRPLIKSNKGSMFFFDLDVRMTSQLKEIGTSYDASLFITILSVYSVLLNKLTNQADIIIGVPTRGRDHLELESILGMFVNTIPIRNQLKTHKTFTDTLIAIRDMVLSSFDHQSFQYDQLVDELGIKRSTNRNPIFDIAFSFDSFNDEDLKISDLEFELYEREFKNSKFDLTLIASEYNDGIKLMFEYSTDLFSPPTLERFAKYFQRIVEQILKNNEIKICDIDVLSGQEKELITNTFNSSVLDTLEDITILDSFSRQVIKNPKSIAISFDGETMSYEDLDKRSSQLANYLLGKGVKSEQLIPLCLNRSIEMIIGILGTLKSGATFVPIDPEYPQNRIIYILNDLNAKLILSETTLKDTFSSQYEIISLDTFFENSEQFSSICDTSSIRSTNLSYIIYTSGTTGEPKGVMCEHKGIVNMVINQIDIIGLTKKDHVLQFASFAFDAFISEIFTTLISGAKLIIPKKEAISSIKKVGELIEKEKITIATLPPSYQAVLQDSTFNMRVIISAGEALNFELTKSLNNKGLKVINAYGPTENTVCTTMSLDPILEGNVVTIGKPIKGVEVYILSEDKQLCPVGVVGELCVSGKQVARGYLNRPEINKQKFFQKSFTEGMIKSLYKTGDRARWLSDGNIEFRGRKDNQIKLRGYRIELEEIENTICKIPNVQTSAVLLNKKQQSLTAYYTKKHKVGLWPSIAEFFLYDDVVYKSMYTHISRNEKYKEALEKVIKGKTVLEIGPGPEAVLSRLCIECGAEEVYAVEIIEETYLKAKDRIEREKLEDRIKLIHGDIMDVDLPKVFDYCVSEIVGSIGGSEGSAVLINDIKKYMKDPKNMIPSRSLTKISAISLDESIFEYGFSEVAYHYVQQIFSNYGENFEFRICLKDLPEENIISDNDVFEDLDYTTNLQFEHVHHAKITFNKESVFNGFFVWMDLYMDDKIHLDIIEDTGSWLPIFLPVAYPGIPVNVNDHVELEIQRKLSSNNVNPDFFIKGQLYRKNYEPIKIQYNSYHHKNVRSGNSFYENLFEKGVRQHLPMLNATYLKKELNSFLPEYMIPSNFVAISKIPLTSNGKVDKKALSNIEIKKEVKKPIKTLEIALIDLWAEILQIDKEEIGIGSDFFVLGGHSLMAIKMVHDINQQFSTDIQLDEIFETSTLSKLVELIVERQNKKSFRISKAEKKAHYKLSSAQKRIYFLYELNKISTMYNVPQFYSLKGTLDINFLESVFVQLVDRHESLRTIFEVADGVVLQKIISAENFVIEHSEENDENSEQLIDEFIKPFNLQSDYPFRVKVVVISEYEYLLMIDMHHIISDGLSYEILLRDFWELYNGECIEPLKLQYKDYAEWQQSDNQKEIVKEDKRFWLDQYKNPVSPLELPTTYRRPDKKSGRGGSIGFDLTFEETSRLKEIAKKEGVTMFMVMLSIYNLFLNKLSNQDDIVVGFSSSNRPNSNFDNVVGMFLNTIPLRNIVNDELNFNEFLQEVKQRTLECFSHQLFQYEELLESLKINRDMGRNPLFDVILVYQEETLRNSFQNTGLNISIIDKEHEHSKFDLALFVLGTEENLKLHFNYAVDLFNEEIIKKFATYFRKTVSQIIINTDVKISEITILSENEQSQLISSFNKKEKNKDITKISTIKMFEKIVSQDSENVALVHNEKMVTYGELNTEANKLAHYLIDVYKIGKGDIIGIKMERSDKLITTILAVQKTGAAYLPIDFYAPEQRTSYMLLDSMSKCLITDKKIESKAKNLTWEESEKWKLKSVENVIRNIETGDNAYIIYTSGTTGNPKGVCVSHSSLSNYITWLKSSYNIDYRDSTALFSSYAYDLCYTSLWGSLLSGGTLHIVKNSRYFNPTDLIDCIIKNTLSYIKLTPSHLKLLYKSEVFIENIKNNSLRLVFLGGEPIDINDVAFYLERKRSTQFVNHYGPTETTIGAIAHNINKNDIFNSERIIGKGIANNEIFILDKNMALLPQGVKGEICIAGLGVSNGYLNRKDLTEEKFINNPYSTGKHDKILYRTGDMARFREDGNIEFLGRQDDQVKIRGHRIELKEVEICLKSLKQITESAVLVKKNQLGEKQLIAYIIPSETTLSDDEIISDLSLTLPDYMVPKRYVKMESFSLTSNGKINKEELPELEVVEAEIYPEKFTKSQSELRDVWADILKLDSANISLSSDFFNLGGHSLLALEIIYKIKEIFFVDISLNDIFEKKTILELNTHIGKLEENAFMNIPKAPDMKYYPLSPAQKRLYFIYKFEESSLAYNMPTMYRVNTLIKEEIIERIFRNLVLRHEGLRTNFIQKDDIVVQEIRSYDEFRIEMYSGKEKDVTKIINKFIRPFDLTKDYLLRIGLIDVEEGGKILMTDKHHIISDGISRKILLRDFWTLLKGGELPALKLQYKDYALWQESLNQVELFEKHKMYWLEKFNEERALLNLNIDFKRPRFKTSEGASVTFSLDKKKTKELRKLADKENVTLFMLFLALYNILLNKLSGSEDIVVGVPVSNRNHVDLENIVGIFIDTNPLRNYSYRALKFSQFLRNVKECCLGAFDHYLYRYENLVEDLNIERDTSRNPLFDVMFTYDKKGKIENVTENEEYDITLYELEREVVKVDLMMGIRDVNNELYIDLSYNLNLFKQETIKSYMNYFNQLIDQVMSNSDQLISEMTVLSISERNYIINTFNETDCNFDLSNTLTELFSLQANKTPNYIALKFHSSQMTYKELDERSNNLSYYLISEGIKPGEIIGILFDRSMEMIVSVLGILKSGCSYLPINPSQPLSRTKFMISDSETKLILTSKKYQKKLKDEFDIICLETINLEKELLETKPNMNLNSDSQAYIIYTSGSTGKPKGVPIAHNSVVNLIKNQQAVYGISDSDCILQFSPIYFDASVEQIWLSLLNGCTLILVDNDTLRNQQLLNSYLISQRVTHFHATPSFFESLVLEGNSSVKRIIAGGEKCKPFLVEKFREYEFYNKYGPTEATVTATIYHAKSNNYSMGSIPIGKPISNIKAYVLDDYMNVVPIGVYGELYLSGIGLSKGYLNRKELTIESFVTNPFSKDSDSKLYKTGDVVRWFADGNLEFLERKDFQVKIRGYRIELEEIESALLSIDSVQKAVVKSIGDSSLDKYLIGYIIADEELEQSFIKNCLKDILPEYMIPMKFVVLEEFPMTPSGKINRKALLDPKLTRDDIYVAPSNDIEEKLVNIWASVLNIDETTIGVNQNFFELGGHSLKAISLANKMHKIFSVEIPLKEIFRKNTISTLAEYIDDYFWLSKEDDSDNVEYEITI